MKSIELRMENEQMTEAFGIELGRAMTPGSLIALVGDLGTGKTALTKAIAKGLEIKEMITSPTFTIVCEYHSGRLSLYHFDVYRVHEPEELFEIGYEEYFFGKGVTVVEWADLVEELLPEDRIEIEISYGKEETERIYKVTCSEKVWAELKKRRLI